MQKKSSRHIFVLQSHTVFKYLRRRFFPPKLGDELSDEEKENTVCRSIFKYRFDCRYPVTFNERLVWLKLHYRNPLWAQCSDKLGGKEFLHQSGFGQYVPRTLGTYASSSEIDLSKLPEKFVLKTNNDSGSVFLCDRSRTNFDDVFRKLDHALTRDYASEKREWVYDSVRPVIFAEEILQPERGDDLADFKFFCFSGHVRFLFVGRHRNSDVRFSLHRRDFALIDCMYIYRLPPRNERREKPSCYDELVSLAEQVSKPFDFVRVDMFATKDGPRIGELTFFSQSGQGLFSKDKYDYEFGHFFDETALGALFPRRGAGRY